MNRLTLIGGGSVRTPFFVHSLAKRSRELNISEVCLYDRDPRRLQIIGTLASCAARRVNPQLRVITESDEERAIKGSAYFVVTIREGGDHSRVMDEEIAQKYGVLAQETTGAGGFFMAARSIPALIPCYEKIRRLVPQAWIFNFTNPSGLVTQAMRSLGYDRVIGICDTPNSTRLRIAKAMGYDNREFYLEFFGLNHLSWARKALYRGRDVLMDILNLPNLAQEVEELAMFDPELLKLLGRIPNEYLYYYYCRDRVLANIKNAGTTRGRLIEENNKALFAGLAARQPAGEIDEKTTEEMFTVYLRHMFKRESSYMKIETAKQPARIPGESAMPETEGYAGIAMDCIAALENGGESQVILSVPNGNSIHGLAPDDVVEISCRVDSGGPHPVYIGTVDDESFSLIKAVKTYERLSSEAVIEGRKDCAVRALMAHPLIGSYHTAKGLVEEFINRQDAYAGHWK